jgi:hypothetical protein
MLNKQFWLFTSTISALAFSANPTFAIEPQTAGNFFNSSNLDTSSVFLIPESLDSIITFREFTPPGNPGQFNVSNEYNPQGITLINWYRYVDPRDTNDQIGISLGLVPGTGAAETGFINFLNPVENLQIEWFTLLGNLNIEAFDISGSLLGSLSNLSGGNTVSSITGNSISRLRVEGLGGFGQITTLQFDEATPVPEPSFLLGLIGLGIAAVCNKKNKTAKN